MSDRCSMCGKEFSESNWDCGGDCEECIARIEHEGIEVIMLAGHAGHDREITLTFLDIPEALGGPGVARMLERQVKRSLPESWKVENRGTRLELHPSGRFAGGFDILDIAAVTEMCVENGWPIDDRSGVA